MYRFLSIHLFTPMGEILRNIVYDHVIDRHLGEPITLADLASHVHRNSGYISTLFKKEMKINFSDYIKKQRIGVAKHMLIYTNREYAEIGNILGFSSQSYFIKIFHQETGFTPKDYRKHFYMQDTLSH